MAHQDDPILSAPEMIRDIFLGIPLLKNKLWYITSASSVNLAPLKNYKTNISN